MKIKEIVITTKEIPLGQFTRGKNCTSKDHYFNLIALGECSGCNKKVVDMDDEDNGYDCEFCLDTGVVYLNETDSAGNTAYGVDRRPCRCRNYHEDYEDY